MLTRLAFALVMFVAVSASGARAAQRIDDLGLRLPAAGDYALRVITPTLLELEIVTEPQPNERPLNLATLFHSADFHVTFDGEPVAVTGLGFKRRVLYAPVKRRDLRVTTDIYLQLNRAIATGAKHVVEVSNARGGLWPAAFRFDADTDDLRYSPALHVNQEGYTPHLPKTAFAGYYLGTLGELSIPADAGFELVDARTGQHVFQGKLRPRRDVGFEVSPKPYQRVYEADFSEFDTPGEYKLVVPKLGASLPFRIDDGELLNFTRAYALGVFHQRCGEALELPFTRFTHAACHTAPADVPWPAERFAKSWEFIASAEEDSGKGEHPEKQLKRPQQQLYPFVRTGKIDVSGGHHDAGDYSKYTINSANLIHALIFAVDSFPGVAQLDNLGLPESGDGIGDVLQEAKWESDFLSKMQDDDGGFYFLVYPKERRYEAGTPEHGDPQIVWPKTTSVTAAAVAALAQCGSSPEFQRRFPREAAHYREQALRGWTFLRKAIAEHGLDAAYQRLTHYGDLFEDRDELAWAACELFVATGDPQYEAKLKEWYPNPNDAKTRQWEWRRAVYAYGNTLRSYAFAESSGRLRRNQLDPSYLAKCELELRRAGDDALHAAEQNAYGLSYPGASKRLVTAGWFFACDETFDLTVAYQLEKRPQYVEAVLSNLNYEAGANPVNRALLTGMGIRRQREIVHQYAQGDDRVLPPSGIPIGTLQSQFHYMGQYKTELRDQSFPHDELGPQMYPLYDRWSDAYNLSTEFVVVNQARGLASLAYWAAQTPLRAQLWRAAHATIVGGQQTVRAGTALTFRLECRDLDLTNARIVWEARGEEPAFGSSYTVKPHEAGAAWVEAEAALPDGRRVFARSEFRVDAPVVLWIDGKLPDGATTTASGGDAWSWTPAAQTGSWYTPGVASAYHPSHEARGIHEHAFDNAERKLEVEPGDVLFADVYLDPRNPPKTVMLEWNDGSLDHRAFWGENKIPWGKYGTANQWPMGRLPARGRWVRLKVPAKDVGLEGRAIKGMAFRLYDGAAQWGAVGKMSGSKAGGAVFSSVPFEDRREAM